MSSIYNKCTRQFHPGLEDPVAAITSVALLPDGDTSITAHEASGAYIYPQKKREVLNPSVMLMFY